MVNGIPIRGCEMCDHCGANSRLYEAFAACSSCRQLTCHACAKGGSWQEGDEGSRDEVVCLSCDADDALDAAGVPDESRAR